MLALIILTVVIALNAAGAVTTVLSVGKNRAPVTPGVAAGVLALQSLMISGLVFVAFAV